MVCDVIQLNWQASISEKNFFFFKYTAQFEKITIPNLCIQYMMYLTVFNIILIRMILFMLKQPVNKRLVNPVNVSENETELVYLNNLIHPKSKQYLNL